MKDFWIYNALRLSLLISSFAIVLALWAWLDDGQVNIIGVAVIAFLLSGVVSWFLLARQREKVALRLQDRAQGISKKMGRSQDSDKF